MKERTSILMKVFIIQLLCVLIWVGKASAHTIDIGKEYTIHLQVNNGSPLYPLYDIEVEAWVSDDWIVLTEQHDSIREIPPSGAVNISLTFHTAFNEDLKEGAEGVINIKLTALTGETSTLEVPLTLKQQQ